MANFNDIKHEIDQNVNTNGVQAITGAILNETLKDMIDEVDAKKQDTLVAGQNITIQGNVISASGGSGETYTAGTAINIDSNNRINVVPSDLPFYLAGRGLGASSDGTLVVIPSDIAGTGLIGIDEGGGHLEIDPSVVQEKLTAGDGIEIDQNNEISVKAGTGLGFDANGYLINTGGGGGGTTYTAGDGIEIDQNDAINAKLGNGLQLDQNNNIEVDTTVVATQNDLSGKQDALTAGTNISISGSTISATDTTYSAGSGLSLNGTTFSIDGTVVATQNDLSGKQDTLTASNGISIDASNNISVKAGTGLAFDSNGNLYATGGGGGTTYTAGNGIDISAQDVISVDASDLAGAGLTVDQNGALEVNIGSSLYELGGVINVDATYLAGPGLENNGPDGIQVSYGDGLELGINNELKAKLGSGLQFDANGAIETTGGGGGTTYTAGDGIDITSNAISVKASDLAGQGLTSDLNNNLNVDANDLAGNGLTVDANGRLEVSGGGGGSLWTTGTGSESRISSPNVAGTAVGNYSLAAGWSPDATGNYSVALGNQPNATGDNGIAIGYQATAGLGAVAIGYGDTASGQYSFATGQLASATGANSTAIGTTTSATASYATAIGYNAAAGGNNSVALGNGTQTTTTDEQALGKYNLSNNSASDSAATALTIGNGISSANRSNVVEIKKNNDIYVYGVGGFTGSNYSNATTLQDVINNGGGGGQSYTAGDGIEITGGTISAYVDGTYVVFNPNGKIDLDFSGIATELAGAGLSVDSSGAALEVDTAAIASDLSGDFLPIQGGTLQDDSAGATDTSLGIMSPGNGDVSITMQVLQDEATSHITIETNAFHETEPGKGESISDFNVNNHGDTGLFGTVASNFVDDGNGNSVRDDFDSSISLAAPAGQGITAEVYIDAYSSNLSDPGNETSEALISLTDNRGQIEFNPTGFNDGTYTLGFPSLSQNDTIATLSDIPSASSLAGDGLQDDGNGALEVKLGSGLQFDANGAIETTGGGGGSYVAGNGIDITSGTISVDETYLDSVYLPIIGGSLENTSNHTDLRVDAPNSESDNFVDILSPGTGVPSVELGTDTNTQGEVESLKFKGDADIDIKYVGDNTTYTLSFPTLTQNETIATLSDIQGGGSYVAGNGIDITSGTISVDETYLDGVYLPLTGGLLKDTAVGATETLLDVQAPDSTGALSFSADTLAAMIQMSADRDDANVADGTTYGINFDNSGDVDILVKTVNPLDPTDISTTTYTQTFQQKSGTIALLSDISGGGTSYTAGTGISISAQNVISNSAPDPGLWVAGTGTDSIMSFNATSATGPDSVAIGYHASAVANNACSFGANSSARANGAVAVGGYVNSSYGIAGPGAMINGGIQGYGVAFGYNATVDNNYGVAIGYGAYSKMPEEYTIGTYNKYYSSNTDSERVHFSVGNGTSDFNRLNSLEIKNNNDLYIYGVGGFTGANASSASTLQTVIAGKQDTLTAGTGISISGNVISATGGGGSSLWTNGTGTDSLVAPATVSSSLSLNPAAGNGAISCGYDTNADGDYAFAQGGASSASGDYSFAANNGTAAGNYSAAFNASGAYGVNSFAAGGGSGAHADYSVALGGGQVVFDDITDPQNPIDAQYGVAIGDSAAVEGEYGLAFMGGTASGSHSVAIGDAASATEMYSTALTGSTSQGNYSFAASTGVAAGHYSSALSGGNAQGEGSFASGFSTSAHGYCSAALGYALSTYSQADGTTASDPNAGEVALGRYNYSEADIIFSVGCGYYDSEGDQEVRENAIAIDSSGNIFIKGLGGYTGQTVSGATSLQTFLNNL